MHPSSSLFSISCVTQLKGYFIFINKKSLLTFFHSIWWKTGCYIQIENQADIHHVHPLPFHHSRSYVIYLKIVMRVNYRLHVFQMHFFMNILFHSFSFLLQYICSVHVDCWKLFISMMWVARSCLFGVSVEFLVSTCSHQ